VVIKPAKFGDSREIFKSPEFGRFTWRSQLVSITQTNYTVPKSSEKDSKSSCKGAKVILVLSSKMRIAYSWLASAPMDRTAGISRPSCKIRALRF